MHNGVGLRTPRGSGTNGYVQKSLASLPVNKIVKLTHQSDSITRPKSRTDPQILIHEKKREIELKLMELRDTLQGSMTSEEIEQEINKQRRYMINNLNSITLDVNKNEHIMADVKNKQMDKLQKVLKIGSKSNGSLEENKNRDKERDRYTSKDYKDKERNRSRSLDRESKRGHDGRGRYTRSRTPPRSSSRDSGSSSSHSRSLGKDRRYKRR